MRKMLLICLFLLIPGVLLGQTKTVDSVKVIIRDPRIITLDNQPLYIIDNAVVDKPKIIDTAGIFNIALLKTEDAMAVYGSSAVNGVVLITTKKYAIKSYQKKLSEFSQQYKEYLRDSVKNQWRFYVTYNINGKIFAEGQKGTTTALYNLKQENLTSILIDKTFDYSYSPATYYKIYITTKN